MNLHEGIGHVTAVMNPFTTPLQPQLAELDLQVEVFFEKPSHPMMTLNRIRHFNNGQTPGVQISQTPHGQIPGVQWMLVQCT